MTLSRIENLDNNLLDVIFSFLCTKKCTDESIAFFCYLFPFSKEGRSSYFGQYIADGFTYYPEAPLTLVQHIDCFDLYKPQMTRDMADDCLLLVSQHEQMNSLSYLLDNKMCSHRAIMAIIFFSNVKNANVLLKIWQYYNDLCLNDVRYCLTNNKDKILDTLVTNNMTDVLICAFDQKLYNIHDIITYCDNLLNVAVCKKNTRLIQYWLDNGYQMTEFLMSLFILYELTDLVPSDAKITWSIHLFKMIDQLILVDVTAMNIDVFKLIISVWKLGERQLYTLFACPQKEYIDAFFDIFDAEYASNLVQDVIRERLRFRYTEITEERFNETCVKYHERFLDNAIKSGNIETVKKCIDLFPFVQICETRTIVNLVNMSYVFIKSCFEIFTFKLNSQCLEYMLQLIIKQKKLDIAQILHNAGYDLSSASSGIKLLLLLPVSFAKTMMIGKHVPDLYERLKIDLNWSDCGVRTDLLNILREPRLDEYEDCLHLAIVSNNIERINFLMNKGIRIKNHHAMNVAKHCNTNMMKIICKQSDVWDMNEICKHVIEYGSFDMFKWFYGEYHDALNGVFIMSVIKHGRYDIAVYLHNIVVEGTNSLWQTMVKQCDLLPCGIMHFFDNELKRVHRQKRALYINMCKILHLTRETMLT